MKRCSQDYRYEYVSYKETESLPETNGKKQ